MACFLSESADPVVKGPGMNPMFLASLKISETAAPAFHDQLVLWHCNWTFFNTSTNM